MNNVLVLSAGRRAQLVQYFIDELKKRDPSAIVFTADMFPSLSSACHLSERSFALPRATCPSYVDEVLSLCHINKIKLVVPTIDTELLVLAEASACFLQHGISLVISDLDFVTISRDKRLSVDYFQSIGIASPSIYDMSSIRFPCFAKPYDGSCSKNAFLLNSSDDLTMSVRNNPKMMYMQYIDDSFVEYTVDAYYDSSSALRCLVPRKRLEVRGGEVSKAITVRSFLYDFLLSRLSSVRGARGCITFQFFCNENSGDIYALEINPRFGGGYPLTHESGSNFVSWLIDEYLFNMNVPFFDSWSQDMLMLRFDSHVIVPDYVP